MREKGEPGGLYIGTSGWMNKDWGVRFYPKDMKKGFLPYLASKFKTVEVNTSFYHLPLLSTFEKWYKDTPDDFLFSVKMSRYVTHELRLVNAREPIETLLKRTKGLKEKLGVILVQLPPSLVFDEHLLKKFISALSQAKSSLNISCDVAIEPRHESWMTELNADTVRSLLGAKKYSLVFPQSKRIPSFPPESENIIADHVYVRFHGPSEFAASRYGPRRLKPWAERMREWQQQGKRVYAYFNNDVHGHAIVDARTLKRLLNITR